VLKATEGNEENEGKSVPRANEAIPVMPVSLALLALEVTREIRETVGNVESVGCLDSRDHRGL
jgi:hypothetical protein